ncbi:MULTISPECIES: hypothetical protein [Anaeromyxobacter]|uniref:hypothetical protein n=1 Tax=Anaeromyxobacter TaxID=161492 RepID=UPI001F595E95|nr:MULTISPECIES: hypothetical protein [unclassified Anaeromyxobacter]
MPDAKKKQVEPSAFVNIIVHDDTLTVSPTIVRAAAGEVVQWQAPGADSFVLVFRDGAALAGRNERDEEYGSGVEVSSLPGDFVVDDKAKALFAVARWGASGPIARATLRDLKGVHTYQLAIRKGDKLYLDVGCPEVIIQ